MQCLKCGKDTENGQVFCSRCLAVMKDYPVKDSVPVHLPQRTSAPAPSKSTRRRKLTTEELYAKAKGRIKRLTITVVILSILFLLVSAALGYAIYCLDAIKDIGQNYTATTTAAYEP